MEVSAFSDITSYWTERGWGERGPVKMASRCEVPLSDAEGAGGEGRFVGGAWPEHPGISAVEFSIDGGDWLPAELGFVPSEDCWVQWSGTAQVEPGDHLVRVRAVDAEGVVQTSVERDVLPDGSTGLHVRDFSAS